MSNDIWADFKPDVDVPIPTDTRNSTSYPWHKFQINNSFFFAPDKGDQEDTSKRLKNRLDQSTRTFAISGVRVWRVE
mgnify:CR=1 FL=1